MIANSRNTDIPGTSLGPVVAVIAIALWYYRSQHRNRLASSRFNSMRNSDTKLQYAFRGFLRPPIQPNASCGFHGESN